MKQIYFYVVAVALALSSVTASAQFMNSSTGSRSASVADVVSVFNTFDLTYSPVTFGAYYDGNSETQYMNAISLNYAQARSVMEILPVYLQYGAGLQYAWETDSYLEDGWKYTTTASFLTVKVPVNVLYCYTLPNTSFSLMPFAGFCLCGHLLGQLKESETHDGEKESESYSYFDKEYFDEPYKRITLNWQLGAKFSFNKFIIGVGYEGPITSLLKEDIDGETLKVNTRQFNLSLGIRF